MLQSNLVIGMEELALEDVSLFEDQEIDTVDWYPRLAEENERLTPIKDLKKGSNWPFASPCDKDRHFTFQRRRTRSSQPTY